MIVYLWETLCKMKVYQILRYLFFSLLAIVGSTLEHLLLCFLRVITLAEAQDKYWMLLLTWLNFRDLARVIEC